MIDFYFLCGVKLADVVVVIPFCACLVNIKPIYISVQFPLIFWLYATQLASLFLSQKHAYSRGGILEQFWVPFVRVK